MRKLFAWRRFLHLFGLHWWRWHKNPDSLNAASSMGLRTKDYFDLCDVVGDCQFCDITTRRLKDPRKQ